VAANGTYTATLPAPTADGPLAARDATIAAGNTATDTRSSRWTRHHGCDHGRRGGDNTINAAEAADGIVITAPRRQVRPFS
jgi:hypothetical protein